MNSKQVVDEIRERAMISEVIAERIPVLRRGRRLTAICPFHDDHKPSLTISDEKKLFKCFACGVGGDVLKFVMEYDKMSFPEAVKSLASRYSIEIPSQFFKSNIKNFNDSDLTMKSLLAFVQKSYSAYLMKHSGAKLARQYLRKRSLTSQSVVQHFALGYAANDGKFLSKLLSMNAGMKERFQEKDLLKSGLVRKKQYGDGFFDFFRNRLMFPIRNEKGETLGFGGRSLKADDEIKYINSAESPWFHKSNILYGLYEGYQLLMRKKYALICEGYFDVMAMQCIGEPALAPLGSALTLEQLRKLKRYTSAVVLLFDGDEAGERASFEAASLAVAEEMDGEVVRLPRNEDPYDIFLRYGGKTAAIKEHLAKHSKPLYDYVVSAYKNKGLAASGPPLLAAKQAFERMLPILASMKSQLLRVAFAKKVEEEFHADALAALNQKKVIPLNSLRGISLARKDEGAKNFNELLQPKKSLKIHSTPLALQSIQKNLFHHENCFLEFVLQHPKFIKKATAFMSPEEFQNPFMRFMFRKLAPLKNLDKISLHHILDVFEDRKEIVDYIITKAVRQNTVDPEQHQPEDDQALQRLNNTLQEQQEKSFQQSYLIMKKWQKLFRIRRLDAIIDKLSKKNHHQLWIQPLQEEILKHREEMKNIDEYLKKLEPESLYTGSISAYHSQ